MRARSSAILWAASLLLLAGCASLMRPFVLEVGADNRLETTINTVEICYNRWTTTPDAVKRLANDECVKKDVHANAVFVEHRFLLRCPLLLSANANFECR